MAGKTAYEVSLEMYQIVKGNQRQQKRLRSSTFWNRFGVRSRQPKTVQKIARLLDEQGLDVSVRSGQPLGTEDREKDWILLTLKDHSAGQEQQAQTSKVTLFRPSHQWFEQMKNRRFETEREVESYFIDPLLGNLGYGYDDIVIGYPLLIHRGLKRVKKEVDFVVFDGPGRKQSQILLFVEAVASEKGISSAVIWQAQTYAKELAPACYIVSDGQEIIVFQFNATIEPDVRALVAHRTELETRWGQLFELVSKEATIERKKRMVKW